MSKSKPRNELSLEVIRLALSIVEGPTLNVDGFKLTGAGARRFKSLLDLGALARLERKHSIICQECERRHPALVTVDHESGTATYFCRESGRVLVDPPTLEVYALRMSWVLDWLSGMLRIPSAQRPIPRLENHLWELGEANITGQRLRLFFARKINSVAKLERVGTILDRLSGKGKTGVVLTASIGFRVPHRLPSAFSIVDIREVLEMPGPTVSIDRKRLLTLAEPEATVDRYRTGSRGTPTAMHLYLGELEHRIESNNALVDKGDEAVYLKSWLAQHHPDARQPALKTIKNNIATPHRIYRAGKKFGPK